MLGSSPFPEPMARAANPGAARFTGELAQGSGWGPLAFRTPGHCHAAAGSFRLSRRKKLREIGQGCGYFADINIAVREINPGRILFEKTIGPKLEAVEVAMVRSRNG